MLVHNDYVVEYLWWYSKDNILLYVTIENSIFFGFSFHLYIK
jgi:hypothetical protein